MDIVTSGQDPWGQSIFMHVSWDLLWVSLIAGVIFLIGHATYMVFAAHNPRSKEETDALEVKYSDLPDQIPRHSLMARLFHLVMAVAMFVLLITAFFPIAGIQFPWVTWHWVAGIVLIGSIVFHIIHASFFLDFWSIWVGPKDIPEMKADMLRGMGKDVPGPKPAKYPLGNKMYHLASVVVGLAVSVTGLMMMPRIRTPLFERNPYYMSDVAWGWTYVYMAVRPDNWWITKAMFVGWITRRQYLEQHEPSRWQVESDKA